MPTKNLVTLLMGIVFISSAIAADTVITLSGNFLRKEPVEKVIWYGGLLSKMIFFYDQACTSGESEGCFNLATIYDTGDASVQNKAKAIEYFTKACALDYALACNSLGILYANGVELDYASAVNYFDKSCQLKEEIGCKNKVTTLDLQIKNKR